jgi:hypothetical protein
MNFFQKIGNAIGNFFSKEAPVFENALTAGVNFTNIIKSFEGSIPGQALQAIADALLPGVAPAVFTGLNVFLTDFGLVAKDLTGTPADIAAAGLGAAAQLTGNSKIYALSNIASIVANETDKANGGTSTPQQAIVTIPVVHNPNVLTTPVVSAPTASTDAQAAQGSNPDPNAQAASSGS